LEHDDTPLRSRIASLLIDAMAEIGLVEPRLNLSLVSTARGVPDAYDFEDRGELSAVLLVGDIGSIRMPEISPSMVTEALQSTLDFFTEASTEPGNIETDGSEAIGEIAYLLHSRRSSLETLNLWVVLLGRGTQPLDDVQAEWGVPWELDDATLSTNLEIIDIPTLQDRLDSSASGGSIDLYLSEFLGSHLQCLRAPSSEAGFDTFLAILPGDALANIYQRYKTRILQKNLRNFLQATGRVNNGIQASLKESPEKFLAYNNGLTITASGVELDGNGRIVVLHDFQIVNGGQTTASLDYARRYAGVSIDEVSVQAKIIVDIGRDPSFIDKVSRFANSQNKVKESDFSARDGFQSTLESLMRDRPELAVSRTDAPGFCYWYYEAFRAGYATEKHQRSGRDRSLFESTFPKDMVIDKLLLAKCENLWDEVPHIVCRGADKNFLEWVRRTKPLTRPAPDEDYCRELVAKVILFRFTEGIVRTNFGGLRSQIVAHTVSLLRHILATEGKEIDLSLVWQQQSIPAALEVEVLSLARLTDITLRRDADDEDPAQWAKKPLAWETLTNAVGARQSRSILRTAESLAILRGATFEYSHLVHQVLEEMRRRSSPITRRDILSLLNIDDEQRHWPKIRRLLLEDSPVIQVGNKLDAAYILDGDDAVD
jgi:hypothetical protein